MKVFTFDPSTGRRGDKIADTRRASWTGGRLNSYAGHAPVGFGSDADVTVHEDSGWTDRNGDDHSYRHPTQWICYCLGHWMAGEDGEWVWVVLPPLNEEVEA